MRTAILLLTCALAVNACSQHDESYDDFVPTALIIKGKVEKGPLVRGSVIELRSLDQHLSPNGASYSARIENNTGDFNFGSLKINSPYAKLTADGYFFNEVAGALSAGTIKLDAIADLSDYSTTNVNVLTHIKSQRIMHLVVNEGLTLREANKQAQRELLSQFGLQKYAESDASQYSIIAGNDAAGVLIAISSYVLSDRSEAEIVEYLSKLSTEFSTTGAFSASTKERLQRTKNYLNGRLDEIAQNIVNRYDELGYEVQVKDLAYYFDWDHDGVAGNEIEDKPVVLDKTCIEVPKEGGLFTVTVQSDTPYYLEAPSCESDNDSGTVPPVEVTPEESFGGLYDTGSYSEPEIENTKTIADNRITIRVEQAQFRKEKTSQFALYNARGMEVATIQIQQAGDGSLPIVRPLLGEMGRNAINGVAYNLRSAFTRICRLERQYAQTTPKTPYTPNDSDIERAWADSYQTIRGLHQIKAADESMYGCYQGFLQGYLALAYFTLSSHWGAVPYMEALEGDTAQQIAEERMLALQIEQLSAAINELEEKRNDAFSDENSFLFISKDIARCLLAYCYMHQRAYEQALPLVEKIISNGFYALEETGPNEYSNNAECLLGFPIETRITISEGEYIHPCLDYKDVLLIAAECYYHLNDSGKAADIIRSICDKKSVTLKQAPILEQIAELRYRLQLPNYLGFIRRNQLGESVLGLSKEEIYQLLFPIPYSEQLYNPTIVQNPGY